jgi:hypothetical protein
MADDLKDLEQTIQALGRINRPEAALGRLEQARSCLDRLLPYVQAGLVRLPRPDLAAWLDEQTEQWQHEA